MYLHTLIPTGMKRQGKTGYHTGVPACKGETKRPLILVVDKSTACCELLCSALALADYRARDATDAVTARGFIPQADDPVALVLLDLSFPFQATTDLKRLRSAWQAPPPVIILTTSLSVSQELAATEWVLLKPFHLCDLLTLVQRALSQPVWTDDRRNWKQTPR